jgi:adenosylcobinamide-phosphate synthase
VAVGDPPNRYHPVAWIGRALACGRSAFASGSPSRLLLAGAVATLGVALLATAASVALVMFTSIFGWLGVVIEGVALKSMLSLRGLARAALAARDDLARADLGGARAAVGRDLVSRATAGLGPGQVASAAIESVAENLTDAFLAPLLFFAVFGLPGAVFYRVINTADAMIGYRDGPLLYFGRLAARLDDVLNLVPARLAALLIVAAAIVTGDDSRRALRAMTHDHGLTASPNAGWTMSAMAGALTVTLAKPATYTLGAGPVPTPFDITRTVDLLAVAAALAVPAIVAITLAPA